MADEKKNPLGSVGDQVRANIQRLRLARGLTKKDLADATQGLGRPVPPLGVSRIEAGTRRVDAGDLVVLADALNVSPLDLLLPPRANDEPYELSSGHTVTSRTAWLWALGRGPAMDWEPGEGVSLADPGADPAIATESYERELEFGRLRSEYMRLALPPELRRAGDHPLVRLAGQLQDLVEDVALAPGDRDERLRWVRMAKRRLDQVKLNLEEVEEVLTTGDGLDDLKRQYPGLISHVEVAADGTTKDVPQPPAGSDADRESGPAGDSPAGPLHVGHNCGFFHSMSIVESSK